MREIVLDITTNQNNINESISRINEYNDQLDNFHDYIFDLDEDIIMKNTINYNLESELKLLEFYKNLEIQVMSNLKFY